MNRQTIQWLVLGVLIISSISLVVVFFSDYIPEALSARAIPLAIVVGLSTVAAAISFKE